MRKKIMALSLLGIPFLMPSCSEKEENFNEFQTTETNQIEENGVTAKDIYYEEVHNEDGNPHSGKYTVVNVDENEVLGMYTLEELMGNVVNE